LGWKFNQPIGPGVLPKSLKSLTFGESSTNQLRNYQ
jgi:hypothetical protein